MGKLRAYDGEQVRVTFEASRCIHAAQCVSRLPTVFDTARRPWIDPNGATAEVIEAVVRRCPTGCMSWDGKALSIDNANCVKCMHCINVMPKALRPGDDRGATILLGSKAPIESDSACSPCRSNSSRISQAPRSIPVASASSILSATSGGVSASTTKPPIKITGSSQPRRLVGTGSMSAAWEVKSASGSVVAGSSAVQRDRASGQGSLFGMDEMMAAAPPLGSEAWVG